MRNRLVVSIGTVMFAISAPGFFAHSVADESAPPTVESPDAVTELKFESLLTVQLEGVEGTDVIVSRVTMPPNTALLKHWHPGEEFAYVLSGSTTLRMEGAADGTFGLGEIAKIPLKRVHSASTGEEGATILVFRIHEHGKPERIPVD